MKLTELESVLAGRWLDRNKTFVIGITGGVAAGKSTLAADLAGRIARWPPGLRVELVGTDGFPARQCRSQSRRPDPA